MSKNKFVLGLLFVALLFLSFNYSQPLRSHVLSASNGTKLFFINQFDRIKANIQRHIRQKEQIKELQKQVEDLQKPAELSSVFARKLNQLLDESNLTNYNPDLKLSRVISYEELDNPFRLWIDFPSFDKNRSYGIIYKGHTAGVIYPKFEKPLAYLQFDKRVVFSVLIGENKLLGVIYGNKKNMLIKYIPSHEDVKIGDEVITSGSDKLFYEGVKVGKVLKIEKKGIYKVATVKPYAENKKPKFFYVIELEKTPL